MFYANQVTLIGRAVRDAELKDLGSSKVCSFRIVVNKRMKQRNGEWGEKSCFIDCDTWGQRAEYAANYIKKGKIVRVEAELEQDEWESNGQKRQKHKLYVRDVQVYRDKNDSSSESSSADAPAEAAAATSGGSELPF